MTYRRCGRSGLRLPAISLGIWHNFGGPELTETQRAMFLRAFDLGITHFDAANNYGPPPGSAEENLGRILRGDLKAHRDELIISSKAGYLMWPGPYGEWGSRKAILASADQSLRRLGLDYVDIFYHHRPDPDTPLEESLAALVHLVRSGKALYIGLSNYPPDRTAKAAAGLREAGVPCLIHQPSYSLLRRTPEKGLLQVLSKEGIGGIAFSPLAQGLLTDKYLAGIPADSRAARTEGFLRPEHVTPERVELARRLNEIAAARGQTLAQMAVAWVLRQEPVVSALIGASRVSQIEEAVAALSAPPFSEEELRRIDRLLPAP
jgi:L-glyceraldehyde 3-phosphate reductase